MDAVPQPGIRLSAADAAGTADGAAATLAPQASASDGPPSVIMEVLGFGTSTIRRLPFHLHLHAAVSPAGSRRGVASPSFRPPPTSAAAARRRLSVASVPSPAGGHPKPNLAATPLSGSPLVTVPPSAGLTPLPVASTSAQLAALVAENAALAGRLAEAQAAATAAAAEHERVMSAAMAVHAAALARQRAAQAAQTRQLARDLSEQLMGLNASAVDSRRRDSLTAAIERALSQVPVADAALGRGDASPVDDDGAADAQTDAEGCCRSAAADQAAALSAIVAETTAAVTAFATEQASLLDDLRGRLSDADSRACRLQSAYAAAGTALQAANKRIWQLERDVVMAQAQAAAAAAASTAALQRVQHIVGHRVATVAAEEERLKGMAEEAVHVAALALHDLQVERTHERAPAPATLLRLAEAQAECTRLASLLQLRDEQLESARRLAAIAGVQEDDGATASAATPAMSVVLEVSPRSDYSIEGVTPAGTARSTITLPPASDRPASSSRPTSRDVATAAASSGCVETAETAPLAVAVQTCLPASERIPASAAAGTAATMHTPCRTPTLLSRALHDLSCSGGSHHAGVGSPCGLHAPLLPVSGAAAVVTCSGSPARLPTASHITPTTVPPLALARLSHEVQTPPRPGSHAAHHAPAAWP